MAYDDLPIPDSPVNNPPTPPTPIEYESRNILDQNNNVIGKLAFPVGTSEAIWTEKLAQYTKSIIDVVRNALDTFTVTSSGSTTTSSSTATVVGGMSKTPPSGKYIATFNGSIFTGGASAVGEFGIYIDGVLVPETRRDISCNLQLLGGLVTISLNSIGVGTYTGAELDLSGNQTLDVRFRSTNGGTIGFKERVFSLLKVQ